MHCCTCTSSLSTRWSTWALLIPYGLGDLILRSASRLYAFSGYHNRTSLAVWQISSQAFRWPASPTCAGRRVLRRCLWMSDRLERTTGMLGVRSATGCLRLIVSRSPATPFGATPGQRKKRFLRPRILSEPETRNGLSLARNDAFATITRSTLPPCSFASTPIHLRVPARPKAPPLGSVSKPKPGEFFTFDPLSAPISGAPAMSSGLHSPLGGFPPSGSKRSTGFTATSSPCLTPDYLLLPAARSFDFAPDQRLRPVFVLLS